MAATAIPDVNILTSLLKQFQDIILLHSGVVKGYAIKVLLTVGMIDFLIVVILSLMDEANHPLAQTLLKRTLKYGAFGYMVYSYSTIVNAIRDSFLKIGLAAAGNVMTIADFTNPSQISTMGFTMCGPYLQNLINGKSTSDNGTIIDVLTALPSMLFYCCILILVMFCFFIIAINIFIVQVEFSIFVTLALILVPFGIWDKTEFIFDKVKNGVINFGLKYMAMAFVVSISMTMVKNWTFPGVASVQQYLYVLVGMIAITYLCVHIPSLVGGMMGGGGGSMTAAGLAGFAAGSARNVSTVATKTGLKKAGGAALGLATGGAATVAGAVAGAAGTMAAKVGAMTGFTAKSATSGGTSGGGDTGGGDTGTGNSGSTAGTTTAPPTPNISGVDQNSGSKAPNTMQSRTTPDTGTSTQSAAKTAGPTTPKGPPPIKPSGTAIP